MLVGYLIYLLKNQKPAEDHVVKQANVYLDITVHF